MPVCKIDSSCSVSPMFNQLGKHRPPRRLPNYCRSVYRIMLVPTKACHWPLTCKQQPRPEDLLLETAKLHTRRNVHSFKKKRERERTSLRGRRKTERRKKKREHHTSDSSSFVTPLVMLPSFVYHEKIPLMSQPHQTADPVHEWHLSEPRVNPMIRGNSPKGLCSWEKCLLQRGMQKIPGSTGSPLLQSGGILEQIKGQKWDLRCNEHLKKMFFKDLLETFL